MEQDSARDAAEVRLNRLLNLILETAVEALGFSAATVTARHDGDLERVVHTARGCARERPLLRLVRLRSRRLLRLLRYLHVLHLDRSWPADRTASPPPALPAARVRGLVIAPLQGAGGWLAQYPGRCPGLVRPRAHTYRGVNPLQAYALRPGN